MKKKILAISFVLLLTGTTTFAQKAISEGTFTYDIAIQSATDKTAAVTNATFTVFLKGLISRTDMTSNLGSEKTIYDAKAGTASILKEYSGQKLMITLTKDNWKEKNKKTEGVSYTDQAEKKEILNYQCTKAVAKLSDGSAITVFYTKDITVQNKEYDPLFKNLNGLPLQYEVETGKLKFTYTINKIDQGNLPQAKFDLPKTGYRVITYDENKQGNKKLQ
jgi:GLPGLI family protein